MSIKNKTQLKAEVTSAIHVGGQPTRIKATDIRNLLNNVIDSSISTINNIPPDANGNVTLNISGTGSAVTVNGIAPDVNGNIALNLGDKVTSVNGINPDANGNVTLDLHDETKVSSVNWVSPDANGNVYLDLSDKVTAVNGIRPDEEGNVILNLGGSETSQHFTVRPHEKPADIFFFETGAVTFRESYFSSQVKYIYYRVRVLEEDGAGEWGSSMKIDGLNEFGQNLEETSQYEVEIAPEFTDYALEAGQDARGLLTYSPIN